MNEVGVNICAVQSALMDEDAFLILKIISQHPITPDVRMFNSYQYVYYTCPENRIVKTNT